VRSLAAPMAATRLGAWARSTAPRAAGPIARNAPASGGSPGQRRHEPAVSAAGGQPQPALVGAAPAGEHASTPGSRSSSAAPPRAGPAGRRPGTPRRQRRLGGQADGQRAVLPDVAGEHRDGDARVRQGPRHRCAVVGGGVDHQPQPPVAALHAAASRSAERLQRRGVAVDRDDDGRSSPAAPSSRPARAPGRPSAPQPALRARRSGRRPTTRCPTSGRGARDGGADRPPVTRSATATRSSLAVCTPVPRLSTVPARAGRRRAPPAPRLDHVVDVHQSRRCPGA
jgi:hypothetical protein